MEESYLNYRKTLVRYLSSDKVVEGVGFSQISGQDESLPTAALRGVANTKQGVTEGGIHLGGSDG